MDEEGDDEEDGSEGTDEEGDDEEESERTDEEDKNEVSVEDYNGSEALKKAQTRKWIPTGIWDRMMHEMVMRHRKILVTKARR